jgi:hypothetical protein
MDSADANSSQVTVTGESNCLVVTEGANIGRESQEAIGKGEYVEGVMCVVVTGLLKIQIVCHQTPFQQLPPHRHKNLTVMNPEHTYRHVQRRCGKEEVTRRGGVFVNTRFPSDARDCSHVPDSTIYRG